MFKCVGERSSSRRDCLGQWFPAGEWVHMRSPWQVKCQKASSVIWMQAPAPPLPTAPPSTLITTPVVISMITPHAFQRATPQNNNITSGKNTEIKIKH